MPDIAPAVSSPSIKVNDSPVADNILSRLVSLVVETSVNLPGRFSISFRDQDADVVTALGADVGDSVTIGVTTNEQSASKAIFSGEITALETDFSFDGTVTTVRGYEKSHRLQVGTKARTFVNVTYADIVRKIAADASLSVGTVTAGAAVHDWMGQAGVSDWDLLQAMAAEVGCVVTMSQAGALNFAAPSSGAASVTFERGKDVLRARVLRSASQQASSFTVKTWDDTSKAVQLGSSQAASSSPIEGWSASVASSKLPSEPVGTIALAQDSQSTAQDVADSLSALVAGTATELEATVFGTPSLRAGDTVQIKDFGTKFDGTYLLSGVRHEFDWDGFRTSLMCSGRQDRSLLGLTRSGSEMAGFRAPGPLSAIVTENSDANMLNRVKVKIPALDDTFVTDWIPVVQAGAGKQRGSVFLPEVDDQVLVTFQQGDIRRPVVIGGMHNGKDTPKISGETLVTSAGVLQRAIVSRAGHTLLLVDEEGKEKVSLATGDGNYTVVLDQGQQQITATSNGKVTISGVQDVTISGSQNVTVKSDTNLTLQGQAGVKVTSSGPLELQGATVKISSDGPLEATGAVIKLN